MGDLLDHLFKVEGLFWHLWSTDSRLSDFNIVARLVLISWLTFSAFLGCVKILITLNCTGVHAWLGVFGCWFTLNHILWLWLLHFVGLLLLCSGLYREERGTVGLCVAPCLIYKVSGGIHKYIKYTIHKTPDLSFKKQERNVFFLINNCQ